MENMEEKIMEVLGDPEKLEQIMGIAKNLGFSPSVEQEQETESPFSGDILNLLQQANAPDGQKEALFHAMMPYLRPDKQKKLRRAMKFAKLSHLAGFALKNYTEQL